MNKDIDILAETLSYKFKNKELLETALTHPSAVITPGKYPDNQRLEFLGDAVIGLVIASELYLKNPHMDEGSLTKERSRYINKQVLALCARKLNLGKFLILSPADEQNGGRERESTLADTFEALAGAVFLDGGFEAASKFVLSSLESVKDEINTLYIDNPKGRLQELLQSSSKEHPRYKVIKMTGPDHNKQFECAVYHHGVQLGTGCGKSKKLAEVNAAINALNNLLKPESKMGQDTTTPQPEKEQSLKNQTD